MSVSPIPGVFFLLCDSFIRSKSVQQNVVYIQLEEEAESDQDYRGGRENGSELQEEERAEKGLGQELASFFRNTHTLTHIVSSGSGFQWRTGQCDPE